MVVRGRDEERINVTPARIALTIPAGTPLRIAVDQRVRIDHPGQVVHGKLVEAVYAFDQTVIPAGSVATGVVTNVEPVAVESARWLTAMVTFRHSTNIK